MTCAPSGSNSTSGSLHWTMSSQPTREVMPTPGGWRLSPASALVAAIGNGETFARGRDLAA